MNQKVVFSYSLIRNWGYRNLEQIVVILTFLQL